MGVQSLLFCCLAFAAVDPQEQKYPPHYADASERVYKTASGTDLKLYLFQPKNSAVTDQRPAVLFFFGGGWQNGSPTQFAPHARHLAASGLVGILADYRVGSRQQVAPPECVADAFDALGYVREHAAELGVDPSRIAVAGGSAGGHLAGCVATLTKFDNKAVPNELRPNAAILFNPVLQVAPRPGETLAAHKGFAALARRCGDRAEEISPVHHLKAGEPPVLIFHGTSDTTVPFSTIVTFAEQTRALGNQCFLAAFRGAGHGFFNFNRNEENYDTTIVLMDQFLGRLGWLTNPPRQTSPASDAVEITGGSLALPASTSPTSPSAVSPSATSPSSVSPSATLKDAAGHPPQKTGNESQTPQANPADCHFELEAGQNAAGAREAAGIPESSGAQEREAQAPCIHVRDGLAFTARRLEGATQARIVFFGGSITEGNGWRNPVSEWLSQRYPRCRFEFVNAGIASTGSTTGAFRLNRDVLGAGAPDLLFVDAAVNDDQDEQLTYTEALRSFEGIVRQFCRTAPAADCVVVQFVNPALLASVANGKTPSSIAAEEEVAEHYGVPSVNIACELSRCIEQGTMSWKQYGGTHPQPAGHTMAAQLVISLLASGLAEGNDSGRRALPEQPLDRFCYEYGTLLTPASRPQLLGTPVPEIPVPGVPVSGIQGFRSNRPNWSSIPGTMRPRYQQDLVWNASEPGTQANFSFEGTALGFSVLSGPDAGQLLVSIDDGPSQIVDLWHPFSKTLHYPRTLMVASELAPGPHTTRIAIAKTHHPLSRGTAARIRGVAVNDQPAWKFSREASK